MANAVIFLWVLCATHTFLSVLFGGYWRYRQESIKAQMVAESPEVVNLPG